MYVMKPTLTVAKALGNCGFINFLNLRNNERY